MGVVGTATAHGLSRGNEIVVYDKYKIVGMGKIGDIKFNSLEEVSKCPIIFICVPTPMKISGEIDLSAIDDSIKALKSDPKTIIVIHSTAVSGSTDAFARKYPQYRFAFNPEFLTEKNANEDFINSNRILIGIANPYPKIGPDQTTFDEIVQVYCDAGFLRNNYDGKKFNCVICSMYAKEAEMVKYVTNAFLSTKVTFANEIYQICKKLNIDYDEMIGYFKEDPRIGESHLNVPNDSKYGFGGKCLPKDLNALIHLSREKGYRPRLLEEVWRSNQSFTNISANPR